MRVGWIGLGRLGLPCATAAALRGHDVVGHDLDARRMSYRPQPYIEAGPEGKGDFNDWLGWFGREQTHPPQQGSLAFGTLAEACEGAELIFVAVQTPHDPRFEGITPLVTERADFDYQYLRAAVAAIAEHVQPEQTVVVSSTVLPGTTRREVLPLLAGRCHVAYSPSFIAMSTTMRDYLDPEFVLVGAEDRAALMALCSFWEVTAPRAPLRAMSIESAELAKVAYNTAISTKIAVANTVMELCHQIPEADADDVTGAMQAAHRRLASGAYMAAGMGDGGGCHVRDNIAMSWLAKRLQLSHNLFDDIMRCRDDQARFLAELMAEACERTGLEPGIYGYAYKPGTAIATGSSALLVNEFLKRRLSISQVAGASLVPWECAVVDPVISGAQSAQAKVAEGPRVWLLGCRHEGVEAVEWPVGCVVIDPFRCIPDRPGVEVTRIGEAAGMAVGWVYFEPPKESVA